MIGPTEESTMDSGSTENKMALEPTPLHLERPNKDSGKKENALIGSELQNSNFKTYRLMQYFANFLKFVMRNKLLLLILH